MGYYQVNPALDALVSPDITEFHLTSLKPILVIVTIGINQAHGVSFPVRQSDSELRPREMQQDRELLWTPFAIPSSNPGTPHTVWYQEREHLQR